MRPRLRRRSLLVSAALAACVTALLTSTPTATADGTGSSYRWDLHPTGSEARLRGLAPVSGQVAWASGSLGTVLRTVDGGATWSSVGPPGTEALQFRDIEAFDRNTAVIMSIGTGEDSRIYRTSDGGATWTETFRNAEPTAFYDCMAFWDDRRGLAMSDPVDGKFRLQRTWDGGRTWHRVGTAGMPAAGATEYGFAASGTCLTTGAGQRAYLATGGVDPARVFTSTDRGATWTVADSPVAGGEAAGIFSVRFKDRYHGVLVGGDYLKPYGRGANAAWTVDGGKTWKAPTGDGLRGYRSGADWMRGAKQTFVAVGPGGSDLTIDGGRSWSALGGGSFDSVECTADGACWASGELGRVATLVAKK